MTGLQCSQVGVFRNLTPRKFVDQLAETEMFDVRAVNLNALFHMDSVGLTDVILYHFFTFSNEA